MNIVEETVIVTVPNTKHQELYQSAVLSKSLIKNKKNSHKNFDRIHNGERGNVENAALYCSYCFIYYYLLAFVTISVSILLNTMTFTFTPHSLVPE